MSYSSERQDCSELGAIRLAQFSYGLLEMCYNYNWGYVCADTASKEIATVACHQLGYAAFGMLIQISKPCIS